jgi:hypothetical protein
VRYDHQLLILFCINIGFHFIFKLLFLALGQLAFTFREGIDQENNLSLFDAPSAFRRSIKTQLSAVVPEHRANSFQGAMALLALALATAGLPSVRSLISRK